MLPILSTSRPAVGAATASTRAIGAIRSPAWRGVNPRMNCSSWVRKKKDPVRAKNTSVTAMLAALKRGLRKNWIFSMGWSVCSSQATNAPRATTAKANAARIRPLIREVPVFGVLAKCTLEA